MKKSIMHYAILVGMLLSAPMVFQQASAAEPELPNPEGPAVANDSIGNAPDAGAVSEESPAPDDLLPVPEPPEIPQAVQSGEPLEPEVTIIQRDEETVEETRINGRLYKIKITPRVGPAYYLFDTDGDGVLETRGNNDITDANIPQWVLFSW
ncbi:MAG: DUF2782 domain-containing protein [Gammaproteobacteria bacterium]